MTAPAPRDWSAADLARLVSAPRFARYVSAAGSPERAAGLYAWNVRLTGAVHEELGMLEVVLRNALDRQLSKYHQVALNGDGHWYADPLMPWQSARMVDQIERARAQATASWRVPELHGKVIAELTFGFWRYVLAAPYQNALWAPALRHAFPHLRPARRGAVYPLVDRLNALRNRVAHHEPVHALDIAARHREVLQVAGWIDPAGGAWIADLSRVTAVLAARPPCTSSGIRSRPAGR
jgi:hypothetical protein